MTCTSLNGVVLGLYFVVNCPMSLSPEGHYFRTPELVRSEIELCNISVLVSAQWYTDTGGEHSRHRWPQGGLQSKTFILLILSQPLTAQDYKNSS